MKIDDFSLHQVIPPDFFPAYSIWNCYEKKLGLIGTGVSPSSSRARLKSLFEAFERRAYSEIKSKVHGWHHLDDLVDGGDRIWVPDQFFCGSIDSQTYHGTSSSGTAAHSSRSRSKVGAILELIERDSALCTWWSRSTPRSIDKRSIHRELDQEYQIWKNFWKYLDFFLIENEFGVPVVQIIFRNPEANGPLRVHFATATACRLSIHQAISCALEELAQVLLILFFSPHRRSFGAGGGTLKKKIVSFEEHLFFYANRSDSSCWDFYFKNENELLDIDQCPNLKDQNHAQSLDFLTERFRESEISLYGKDLTSSKLPTVGPVSVFRAISLDLATLVGPVQHQHVPQPRLKSWIKQRSGSSRPSFNRNPHPFG